MYIWHGSSWNGDADAGEPECLSEQSQSGITVVPDYDEVEEIKGEVQKVEGVYRFSPFTMPGDNSGMATQISVEELDAIFRDSMRSADPSFKTTKAQLKGKGFAIPMVKDVRNKGQFVQVFLTDDAQELASELARQDAIDAAGKSGSSASDALRGRTRFMKREYDNAHGAKPALAAGSGGPGELPSQTKKSKMGKGKKKRSRGQKKLKTDS